MKARHVFLLFVTLLVLVALVLLTLENIEGLKNIERGTVHAREVVNTMPFLGHLNWTREEFPLLLAVIYCPDGTKFFIRSEADFFGSEISGCSYQTILDVEIFPSGNRTTGAPVIRFHQIE